MFDLPDDDLATIEAEAWRRLAEGADSPAAPFRRMQVATLGQTGWPELRTVILRCVDARERRVAFHTDRRSAKAAEIAADGRMALHVWDAGAEIQLRLWGQAAILTEGPAVEAGWSGLGRHQRAVYLGPVAPGRVLADPREADPARTEPGDGRGAFAVVEVNVVRFEWLRLAGRGHRRARFDRQGAGWQGRWLAP